MQQFYPEKLLHVNKQYRFTRTRTISPIMNWVQHQQVGQDGQRELVNAILEMSHNKWFNGLITRYDFMGRTSELDMDNTEEFMDRSVATPNL